MTVGLVIVTHEKTGTTLLDEAEFILGEKLDAVECVSFATNAKPEDGLVAIHAAVERAEQGAGVLILADLIGSSPSNRAADLLQHCGAVMVTGINLPMLISVWNYRDKPLGMLARKAVESGRRGIKIIQE